MFDTWQLFEIQTTLNYANTCISPRILEIGLRFKARCNNNMPFLIRKRLVVVVSVENVPALQVPVSLVEFIYFLTFDFRPHPNNSVNGTSSSNSNIVQSNSSVHRPIMMSTLTAAAATANSKKAASTTDGRTTGTTSNQGGGGDGSADNDSCRRRRRRRKYRDSCYTIMLLFLLYLSFTYNNEINLFHIYLYEKVDSIASSSPSLVEVNAWTEEPSRIEMIQDEFIVLNHVCLTNGEALQGPYTVHFFGRNDGDDNNGDNLIYLFQNNTAPYSAWESDFRNGLPFEGTPTASYWTNRTLRQWVVDRLLTDGQFTNEFAATMIDGTTLIAEPHHPDNNFHLHNDFIIPALYKLLKSGTKVLPKEHPRTLLITHGNRQRYERRVVAFDVVLQLFDNVRYSLEQILQEPSSGGIMCFERVIMGGRSQLPYYSHVGRFGADERWKGVLPAIRDWVNTVHGIKNSVTRMATNRTKPKLTVVDRPCNEWSTRCLRNTPDLIRYLSQRFDVSLLSFPPEQRRSEQLMHMLEQMASTDILLGMHGAGLAHAVYLQPGTLLVEIKDRVFREKKLFLNMASLQDVGYYMYDAFQSAAQSPNTILTDEELELLTEDLWRAREQEQEYLLSHNDSDPTLKGECLFPRFLEGNHSMLSSFDSSRCYLEQVESRSNQWWQCTHYGECIVER